MSSRSAGWHAMVTLAGQWTKYGVQILALVVFSRLLDPQDFGIVAMVTAVVGVAYVLGDFGLSLAALQAGELTHGQRSNLFWLTSGIGVLTGLVVVALAPLFVHLYDEPQVGQVAAWIALVFVANGFAGHFRTELNRAHRFTALAVTDVVGQLGGLVAGLVVILTGGGLWGLVVQQVCAAVLVLVLVAGASSWRPGLPRRGEPMRGLLRFGSLSLAASVVNYLSTNLDQLVVGRTWGPATVGVYNRAFQVARVPAQQVGAPLTRVVLPHLRARLDDPASFSRAVHRAQAMLGTALVALFGYLIATAPSLVEVALGAGWDSAVPFVRVLCVAGLLESASRVYYWILLAHGRPGLILGAELGARTIMVVLMFAVVSQGAIWVAWAAVVGQVLLLGTNVLVTAPAVGVSPWPLLRLSLAGVLAVAPATALVAWLGGRPVPGPVAVELLLLSTLWVAVAALSLLVPRARALVADGAGYVRAMLPRPA
ncbi:lipopolysaccharide biosynthesis protein [Nocardioides sp. zg-536]|uniref:Lipopolysaccharide biosynthesis protein n=1 Tax=Nocardioides faecalis TaxID=2803858 RepID=A0A939BX82_9ACTN|nr:lipopolysaccharide biosynthesis protein [Nocardioides faecalis]MBM9461442.1 lipopolysaccharide biosynthesis protein [Nocardioides faecalis]QVI59369.1 lipopolysaccharide biosynthesis protein [Nocardioides faecalis]